MRVLHLDTGNEMRGGQWQALRLLEGLAAAGVECTLLAPPGAPLYEMAASASVRVEPLGIWRLAIEARRHDLIHAHDARAHTLAAVCGGAPLVVARRVAFLPKSKASWKYGRAARYIAVSEYVKSILERRGVPERKIGVVYDGVPPLAEATPGARFTAVAPATADPEKGAGLALAGARLAEVELTLSTNLERDLAEASVFVYITRSEGLGSAALLAMSAGVPVVASKIGGLPEAVTHGENGLLVENEPAAISAAIREIRSDPALARRMGACGRRTVLERFTVEGMVRHTMENYRQVLS